MIPTSSQIRLFRTRKHYQLRLDRNFSRQVSSSRFHWLHSNKSSSKPPTSAIKVILKKLAPAFRSLCLYPRWSPFYQESLRAPLRPANAQRATHTESPSLRACSVRVTCRRRNSHQNRHLTTSSHLQTKQLQVWLGIHKPNHVDVCVQLPQPWRAAAHTAEPVEQGSGPMGPLNVQFTLPRVQQCRPP